MREGDVNFSMGNMQIKDPEGPFPPASGSDVWWGRKEFQAVPRT